jgi:signal transduction histidine kinase
MGLGLAIVSGIVENSGGRIWFESVRGEGTTFFIEWPVG